MNRENTQVGFKRDLRMPKGKQAYSKTVTENFTDLENETALHKQKSERFISAMSILTSIAVKIYKVEK